MVDILERISFKLGIPASGQTVLYVIVGVIVIILIALILIILRRRKFKKVINVNLTVDKEGGNEQAEGTYKSIIKRIKRVKKKYKSILFTSIEAEALPVTLPVNVAVGLAKEKGRCLLIDLDLRRDAVAKVFGFDAEQAGLRAKAVQTEIENLWVWPSHNFAQLRHMNVMGIVERSLDKKSPDRFDLILINAPSVVNSPDRKQIISAAEAVFICTKDESERKKLVELIKPLYCTIIGHIQIPEEN